MIYPILGEIGKELIGVILLEMAANRVAIQSVFHNSGCLFLFGKIQ